MANHEWILLQKGDDENPDVMTRTPPVGTKRNEIIERKQFIEWRVFLSNIESKTG